MNMLPPLLILGSLLIATPARAQDRVQDALDAVNHYRSTVGLPPVVMDDRLNQACQDHTRYLVLNDGRPELEGLKAHN